MQSKFLGEGDLVKTYPEAWAAKRDLNVQEENHLCPVSSSLCQKANLVPV